MIELSLSRSRILLEILFLYIVPVLLLYFNVVPRAYFLAVLVICTSFVLFIIYQENISRESLGIRRDNIRNSFVPYTLFTLVCAGGLVLVASLLDMERVSINLFVLFFGWSIPIGIVQEFLYRGFLMSRLHRLYRSSGVIILANAGIFAFMHILWEPPLLILPLMFIGGIGFAWTYERYPNLALISLSHGILNFVAIWYGFF